MSADRPSPSPQPAMVASAMVPLPPKRPGTLTAIAIIQAVVATTTLLGSFSLYSIASSASRQTPAAPASQPEHLEQASSGLAGVASVLAGIVLVVCGALIVGAVGLWRLQGWGAVITRLAAWLSIAAAVAGLVVGVVLQLMPIEALGSAEHGPAQFMKDLAAIVSSAAYPMLVIVVLSGREARDAFAAKREYQAHVARAEAVAAINAALAPPTPFPGVTRYPTG